jgi:hypothetical protein
MTFPTGPRSPGLAVLFFACCAALPATTTTAATDDSSVVFTLYRNSAVNGTLRMHVATFDAADGKAYNMANCSHAAELFEAQPGVKTRFWCEPGRYRQR